MGDLSSFYNITSVESFILAYNTSTGGLFGNLILLLSFIMSFIGMNKKISTQSSFLLSLFFTTIMSIITLQLGLTVVEVTYLLAISTATSFLLAYYRREN